MGSFSSSRSSCSSPSLTSTLDCPSSQRSPRCRAAGFQFLQRWLHGSPLHSPLLLLPLLFLLPSSSTSFYLPGMYPVAHPVNSTLAVKLNSMTSVATAIPFSYYDLPFCRPPGGAAAIERSRENFGEVLHGDRIETSPYALRTFVTQQAVKLCDAPPLSADDVAKFKERIDEVYRVNLLLDNLPVTTETLENNPGNVVTGVPVGFRRGDGKYYVYNHLMFKVLVHPFKEGPADLAGFGHLIPAGSSYSGASSGGGGGSDSMSGFATDGFSDPELNEVANRLSDEGQDIDANGNLVPRGAMTAGGGSSSSDAGEGSTASAEAAKYLVVGFEVAACSFSRAPDPAAPPLAELPPAACTGTAGGQEQLVEEGASIVYTYDVFWEKSPIKWASRWDAYLKMNGEQVHWFSILNSITVVAFLAAMVAVILLRAVHRDFARLAEAMDKEEAAAMAAEESGWKTVAGDVFRTPRQPQLLCIVVANGVQLAAMAAVTIGFAALGFMSPASRGALLMGMVFLYLLLGLPAGYVGARLWSTISRGASPAFVPVGGIVGDGGGGGSAGGTSSGSTKGALQLALRIACFFPGLCAMILTTLNFLLWGTGSSGAVPFTLFFYLFFLWFIISVPLTVVGVRMGLQAPRIEYPVRTTQIPRQVPDQRFPAWVVVLAGGILPFGTLYIELFFIMSSMWMQRVYYCFGFLFIVLLLLVIVCAEVAVVLTYVQLTLEDYRWWWRSFLASGSVALYAFAYAVNYLIVDLHRLSGTLSAVLFLGYSSLMSLAILLATGAVGFLSSFGFVYYLFASVKLD